jgi:hypothetical protein
VGCRDCGGEPVDRGVSAVNIPQMVFTVFLFLMFTFVLHLVQEVRVDALRKQVEALSQQIADIKGAR